jgi:beta-glucanase (GH16 family)
MQLKLILYAALALSSLPATADEAPKVLLEMKEGAERLLTPSSAQVTISHSTEPVGIVVTIQPGDEGYPGVSLKPEGETWDLSKYGHVEARVVNTGEKPGSISLRIDNNGNWEDNPWNTESVYLQPGETGTISTIFGYSYGKKPGYALKPEAVSNLLLFATKSDAVQSFRIESLQAAGPTGEKPPVDPNSIRIKPEEGVLLGHNVKFRVALSAENVQPTVDNGILRAVFSANQAEQSIAYKPLEGRWDLREALQLRVQMKNEGTAPFSGRLRLESNGGPSNWVEAKLEAGAEREIIVPFYEVKSHNLSEETKPNQINNDAVSALVIEADKSDVKRSLGITSIKADVPTLQLPDWSGKRPPVEGDWVQTLNENFDGPLDTSIWEVYGENYWDKQSHFSKDNVTVENGVVKIRYEKKTGFHNDDPKRNQTEWQSGYLHTYDKWAQRYGYFEARMKLPKAPGLWPAFWMMPDRGNRAEEQWKRQDTKFGGMEFDIMEHLTRWGPNRYNIAMHYDGYDKEHKSIGSDKIYAQPDKDGFITAGLLWTPGSAIFYANGVEVSRWENERISNVPGILMFTLPMGGWDNDALDEKKLPDDFIIDYVRVWQRKDLASPEDGKKAPK